MDFSKLQPEDQHSLIMWQKSHQRGRLATGVFIILFGTLFLFARIGFPIPTWSYSWPVIVMAIGIVVLIKHKFKKLFGYGLFLFGLLFLFKHWYPHSIKTDIVFPVLVILFGISFIFKKRNKHFNPKRFSKDHWKKMHEQHLHQGALHAEEDFLDTVCVFGGVQKTVVSKQFKGADIVTIFGGNEINLSQADFEDRVVFDISCFFGGTTLSIPSDWQVSSEVVTIFGGIEDKRPTNLIGQGEKPKILILRGTCMFGGIEINSFQK